MTYPILTSIDHPDYREYSHMMFTLPLVLNAKTVVETGLSKGISTRIFLESLSKMSSPRELHTYEHQVNREDCKEAIESILKLPHSRMWTLHDVDSTDTTWEGGKIDLLFLDSDHSYLTIIKELSVFNSHLSDKAIIFTHDSWPRSDIPAHMLRNSKYGEIRPTDTYWALKEWGEVNGWKNVLFQYPEGMTLLFREKS